MFSDDKNFKERKILSTTLKESEEKKEIIFPPIIK